MGVLDDLKSDVERLRASGLERSMKEVASRQGPEILLKGPFEDPSQARRVLNVCSNDYLSLAAHPQVIAAAKSALDEYGMGAGAARLIVGNLEPHARLEEELARFFGAPVLLYSSGYHANTGALPVIAGEGDLVISDQLNHASLIDGCRLARASVGVYPHGSLESVERALSRTTARRRVIVTESLFSMDGDLAPLSDLWEIAQRYEAFLYVDEAHAAGVLGPEGRGACAAAGIPLGDPLLIRMATLGKAYGSYGAFIAASPDVLSLLRSRSRGFIFTTGVPPASAAAASAALAVSRAEPERRTQLLKRSAALRAMLAAQGWEVGAASAQIVPLPVGDAERTMIASAMLLERGIYCQGIRPPTVPAGQSRLRLSLTAGHGDAHLTVLARALGELAQSLETRSPVEIPAGPAARKAR